MANEHILHLNEKTFAEKVLAPSAGLILVDFWAVWCGPCRMVAPILDQVAEEILGVATVAKVDIDENPGLAREYGVMSVPTMILFKDGKQVAVEIGVRNKADILAWIRKFA